MCDEETGTEGEGERLSSTLFSGEATLSRLEQGLFEQELFSERARRELDPGDLSRFLVLILDCNFPTEVESTSGDQAAENLCFSLSEAQIASLGPNSGLVPLIAMRLFTC